MSLSSLSEFLLCGEENKLSKKISDVQGNRKISFSEKLHRKMSISLRMRNSDEIDEKMTMSH